MSLYEFKILQYAISELEPSGTPFAVVFSFLDVSVPCIRGFLLSEWKHLFHQQAISDLQYVQGFVDDLLYYSRQPGPSVSSFLEQLQNLDVGPVRIASEGRGQVDELRSIAIPEADLPFVNLPSDLFKASVQALQQASQS